MPEIPVVAVIMSTYNGEKYLAEQVDSILAQEGVHVELFIRDDGSTDSTRDILTHYADTHNNIHINFGSNVGCRRSFITELNNAPEFDYYSFSDQDDYWYPDKLITAVKMVKQKEHEHSTQIPIMYYSNVHNTDSKLKILRTTRKNKRLQSLECAILFRCIGGCTMLFNSRVREIVKSRPITDDMIIKYHDGFVATIVYAFDGVVICDPEPHMLHRVHGHNTSGTPIGIIPRAKSIYNSTKKYKYCEAKITRAILNAWGDEIPPHTRDTLETVAGYRENIASRLKIVFSPKFRTGDWRLTLFCKFRALIGWL